MSIWARPVSCRREKSAEIFNFVGKSEWLVFQRDKKVFLSSMASAAGQTPAPGRRRPGRKGARCLHGLGKGKGLSIVQIFWFVGESDYPLFPKGFLVLLFALLRRAVFSQWQGHARKRKRVRRAQHRGVGCAINDLEDLKSSAAQGSLSFVNSKCRRSNTRPGRHRPGRKGAKQAFLFITILSTEKRCSLKAVKRCHFP